ncbi:MAG: hypothetical protein ACP5KS_07150, partial [Candidatus Hydrogenedens sp.]
MFLYLLTTVICFSVSQTNIPLSTNSHQPIRNYWEHIQGLIQQFDEIRESDIPNKTRYSRTVNKKYPFDLFRSLTPRELIRACRESIKSAREEGKQKHWTEEEISLKCEENISYALEYCGILIEKSSEVDYLIFSMGEEQEEPELRLFLLNQCIPNRKSKSLFSLHFQMLLNKRAEEYLKTLSIIVKRVTEKPNIQIAGIDALYSFFLEQYQKCIIKDPIYQAYANEKHEKITPLWLENPQIPKPLETTQMEINKLDRQLEDFIVQLELKITDKRQIHEAVAKKSKEVLEKIYNNLPVKGKERLKTFIS